MQFFILGARKVIKEEGMPVYRNTFERGDLIIEFNIKFPPPHFIGEPELKVSNFILFFSSHSLGELLDIY